MQENVGNVDRWVRVALGGALVLGAARALGARGAVAPGLLLAGGAILLETALTRVCPLNGALGIDSRGWEPFGHIGSRSENGAERAGAEQDLWRAETEGGT